MHLPDSKPKLDSISPLQYMEASLRILREMATKDGASLPQVMQYVGYLVKVANMGQRFQWKSVVQYDSEYRKAQAESGFNFGADSSYMMQLHLRDHGTPAHAPPSRATQSSHPQTRFDPSTGKPVCGQYNTMSGCRMKHCNYAHVCRSCFKPHSFTHHSEASGAQPPKN
jgi:hypothetical protein